MSSVRLALLLLLPLTSASSSSSSFVDLSFTCPVQTSCPQVCSPTYADCPEELKCRQLNQTLCTDGSCAIFCDAALQSPCAAISACSPVTCASIITYYDACMEDYGPWYDFAADCYGLEGDDTIASVESRPLDWNSPAYVFVYCWVSITTLAIVHWCWYNQRICPIEGSTKTMLGVEKDGTSRTIYQTGYKTHAVGTVIYGLTMLTFAGWFGLQVYLTHLYATAEGEENILLALRTFAASWIAGFIWNCTLLWPHTIRSLFLRRCELQEATHVAVFQEMNAPQSYNDKETLSRCFPLLLQRSLSFLEHCVRAYFTLIFADPNCRPEASKGLFAICPVQKNDDGSNYLVFLFRRHNFQKTTGTYELGIWDMGKTFQALCPPEIRCSAINKAEAALEQIMMDSDTSDTRSSTYSYSSSSKESRLSKDFCFKGLSTKQAQIRLRTVGPNIIDVPAPSFFSLLVEEIAHPFYLYQIYIVWTWIALDYLYATVIIWLIVLMTATIISWFRFRGQTVLYGISHIDCEAHVLRDGKLSRMNQIHLVPGDIVKLNPGVIHCDMLLLSGETVVDESALTGEATPQAKSPIDPDSRAVYNPAIHKKQTLSAGTTIIECEDSIALVFKTASNTTKGELMRDVLVFRKHHLKFHQELPVVIFFLTSYSTLSFLIVMFTSSADDLIMAWFLGMSAFANAFPPLLPTTFIIPVGFAFERLARKGVACSNSDSILIAGQVNAAFFDKTGTLTKQGMDFVSVRSVESWNMGQWSSDITSMAMCVCHSLTKSSTGALIGNPVDQAMFHAGGGTLIEASAITATVSSSATGRGKTYQVIRRFDFDHNRMTQAVIVRQQDGTTIVFVKGSGEAISKLCDPQSLPETFFECLSSYSRAGVYQIAIATKELVGLSSTEVAALTRDQVEMVGGLQFAGVLNFANQMREDTPEVIKQLNQANIQSIMLTGDNMFTGIHIARKAGIMVSEKGTLLGLLDTKGGVIWRDEDGSDVERPELRVKENATGSCWELAMSGEAWQVLLSTEREYAIDIAPFIRVFGRCSPLDKVSVVDTYTFLGFTTIMCGDGGNDCGALRAAHIGLALSDSDASIVAPLTSLSKDISDVLKVLKEGRASMASTIAAYKYVIMYGNVSSSCQLIMYYLGVSFSDWMWIFTDVCWTVSFTLTLPRSRPADLLSKARPTASLLSLQTVGGIVGIIMMNYFFMAIALETLYNEDWFQCRQWQADNVQAGAILSASDNYEISVVFLMVGFQLISAAAAFNFGYEHRQAWYRNYLFAALVTVFAVIHIFITLYPGSMSCLWRINCDNEHVVRGVLSSEPAPIVNPYNSTIMPLEFRWKLLGIMLANGACVIAFEYFIVNGWWERKRNLEGLAAPTKLATPGIDL